MKFLGVDYGKRHLGLAVSDGDLASSYKTLEVSSLSDALDKVLNVIKKEKVNSVVVGVPESGEIKALIKKFISELQKKQIVVEEIEETLTSQNANKLMIELGVGQRKRKLTDMTAACLILQSYLDEQK